MLAMTAMAPQFAYVMKRKHPDSNVLRIHIMNVIKGSQPSTMAQLW